MTVTQSAATSTKSSSSSSKRSKKRPQKSKNKKLDKLNIQSLNHLALHLGCDDKELLKWASKPENFYKEGVIEHPVKPRPKCTPKSPRLKKVLKRLNDLLQRLAMDPAMHGGRRDHSPLTNAKPHQNQDTLMKFDIEDFFPSINRQKVKEALIFGAGCSPKVSETLASICTPFDQLPQGSPHSMMVAALVIDPMVKRLRQLAELQGGSYTQYVDDSAISGPVHIENLERLAVRIIESEGLKVNEDKTSITRSDREQVVTGYRIDNGVDIPSNKIDEIKQAVSMTKEHKPTSQEICSIEGKISYYKQVNPGAAKQLRRKLIRNLRGHGTDLR